MEEAAARRVGRVENHHPQRLATSLQEFESKVSINIQRKAAE
jgi:hypothetical protein